MKWEQKAPYRRNKAYAVSEGTNSRNFTQRVQNYIAYCREKGYTDPSTVRSNPLCRWLLHLHRFTGGAAPAGYSTLSVLVPIYYVRARVSLDKVYKYMGYTTLFSTYYERTPYLPYKGESV